MQTDFSKVPEFIQVVTRAVGVGNLAIAIHTKGKIQSSLQRLGRYTASPAGSPPNNRRNSLRNSFGARLSGDMSASVTTNSLYARVHEEGARITAVNVQFLRIPLNQSAAAFAEDIGTASLRNYEFEWRPLKRPKANQGGMLVYATKYRAKGYKTVDGKRKYRVLDHSKPRFLLQRSVDIPPRPYIIPTWNFVRNDSKTIDLWVGAVAEQLASYKNIRVYGRFK